ncbi:hypothetical protein Hanom_Chr06g00537111 [Helianthus anomalus]
MGLSGPGKVNPPSLLLSYFTGPDHEPISSPNIAANKDRGLGLGGIQSPIIPPWSSKPPINVQC